MEFMGHATALVAPSGGTLRAAVHAIGGQLYGINALESHIHEALEPIQVMLSDWSM